MTLYQDFLDTNITDKPRGNSEMLLNQGNSKKEVKTLPVVSLAEYDPYKDFPKRDYRAVTHCHCTTWKLVDETDDEYLAFTLNAGCSDPIAALNCTAR